MCRLFLLLLIVPLWPAVAQMAGLRSASTVDMPARADSNSPAYWAGGQLQIINSDGTPRVSGGADQFNQSGGVPVAVDRQDHQPMWIESAWMDDLRGATATTGSGFASIVKGHARVAAVK
jgi:hypothetical protein